jgi:uncharacterized protein
MILFDEPGPANTKEIIKIAGSVSHKYNFITVASITGKSALLLSDAVSDSKIICVTCPQGMYFETQKMSGGPFNDIAELRRIRDKWKEEGLDRIPMTISGDVKEQLKNRGIEIIQGTMPFFGPSFSMRLHLNHVNSLDIIAKTLELVSTGTLVCLETVLMAVDSGVLPEGIEVLSLAGTELGLDTACIIRSSSSANLFHPVKGARFIEFIAKPKISHPPDINIEYLR